MQLPQKNYEQDRLPFPPRVGGCEAGGWRLRFAPLLCALVALTGCMPAFLKSSFKREPLILVAFEGSMKVHPGDALEIEAVLISQYKKPLALPFLNATSISFWFTDENGRTFKREPVASGTEDASTMQTLTPGQQWRRRFVITQATETTGTLRIQLVYGVGGIIAHQLPDGPVSSSPLKVTVAGDRSFHRDSAGVLLREDAIRIARDWAHLPEVPATATLVRNEWDVLVWWVRFNPEGSPGVRKACLVDPYLGRVRAEVDPSAIPPEKKEPELKAPPPLAPVQPLRDLESRK